MWVVLSNLSQKGSGYSRIMTELCNRLVEDHEIQLIAMGIEYKGEEHFNKFRIVPCQSPQQYIQQIKLMLQYNVPISGFFVAADLPIQQAIISNLRQQQILHPYIGFFPLESGPVCQKWVPGLLAMNDRIIMSEHGRQALENAGIPSHYVPIGVSPNYVPLDAPDIIKQYRETMGVDEDTFMILTVADNQERKNLAAAFEMVSEFSTDIQKVSKAGYVVQKRDKKKVKWILVTRPDSPIGWDLNDMAMRYGLMDKKSLITRGIPDAQLLALYQAADCFLLTSKAEGLAMPVLEAMATRLLVVGTRVSAIEDHLEGEESRGILIEPNSHFMDPYGNGIRAWASIRSGVNGLELAYHRGFIDPSLDHMLDAAESYVKSRTWDQAASMIAQIINDAGKEEEIQHGEAQAA